MSEDQTIESPVVEQQVLNFEYEQYAGFKAVRAAYLHCERNGHNQIVSVSTFRDGITQVCFDERKVRSTQKLSKEENGPELFPVESVDESTKREELPATLWQGGELPTLWQGGELPAIWQGGYYSQIAAGKQSSRSRV